MEGLVQDQNSQLSLSLKRRSLLASIGQIVLVGTYVLACFSFVRAHWPIQVALTGIVLIALFRARLSIDSRVFPALFACLALFGAIFWSLSAVSIIRIAGYREFESLMFLFLCSGVCASSLGSLVANFKLCVAYISIILLPISLALGLELKGEALLLGVVCLTYLAFLYSQAKAFSVTFLELQERNEEKEVDVRKMKALVDAVPGYVSWIGVDGNYLGANEHILSYLGFSMRQFKKLKIGELDFDPDFVSHVTDFLHCDLHSTGFEWVSEHGGQPRYMKTYLSKVSPNNGAEIAAVICSFDVTEQHLMQKEHLKQQIVLANAEKWSALGELAGNIAHEISNPLTIVNGLAQKMLKVDYFTDPKGAESMRKIYEASERISRIVKSVSALSRGGGDGELQQVYLSNVYLQAVDASSDVLKKSAVRLELDMKEDVQVMGDETQLLQVFLNVIKNSCDAIKDLSERWIKLSFQQSESGVVKIIFMDSGRGLSVSQADQVFSSSFTTKAVGEGTGLGLSICKKIVDRFNGRIYFVPESKNTTLVIELNAFNSITQGKAA